MDTINELGIVVLRKRLIEHGLEEGDVGTVVHVYEDGRAMEVEFTTGEGKTVAVVTLESGAVRLMERREILHVRQMAA